jgi:hypothetical protein
MCSGISFRVLGKGGGVGRLSPNTQGCWSGRGYEYIAATACDNYNRYCKSGSVSCRHGPDKYSNFPRSNGGPYAAFCIFTNLTICNILDLFPFKTHKINLVIKTLSGFKTLQRNYKNFLIITTLADFFFSSCLLWSSSSYLCFTSL